MTHRGFSPLLGRFIHGWFHQKMGHTFITPFGQENPVLTTGSPFEVDPASVGRKTNVKDSLGRDIYNGDIISFTRRPKGCFSHLQVIVHTSPVSGRFFDESGQYRSISEYAHILQERFPGHLTTTVIGNTYEQERQAAKRGKE